MNQLPRIFALSAGALAATLLVTACGGGDAEPPPPPAAITTPPPAAADTTPPTVSVSDSVSGTTATGDVTFTFNFSEDVGISFTADDVAVTGGTKGTFLRTATTQATLVVSPTANTTGTIALSVGAGLFKDLAGNANTGTVTASRAYNTVIPVVTTKLVTFDEATAPKMEGFGGAEDSTVVADPTLATNKVGKVVKSAAAELWAGTTVSVCPNSAIATLPFSATNKKLSARVWSPDAGIPVRLKVEDAADGSKSVETEATVTTAAGWQVLTFDFANPAAGTAALNLAYTYNKASIFFNFGKTGAQVGSAKTYYFDDLSFVGTSFTASCPSTGGGGTSSTVKITFDEATPPLFTGFGGAEDASIVADPTNAANKVAKVIKAASAELWAGTTVSNLPNQAIAPIGFTAANATMTVRVWSPDAGIPVRLKVENAADGTKTVETEATVTTAGAWQTLTFNFANPAAGTAPINLATTYDKVSIFFNFGKTGGQAGGAKTYYFEDITYAAAAASGGGGTGGGTGLVKLSNGVFASNYKETPTPWISTEGGTAGRYIDTGVPTLDWWSGLAAGDATPSFYFGYGINSATKPWGFGAYVSAPGNGTADMAGYSNAKVSVWGNDELFGTNPTLTVILKGATVAGCTSELKGTIAVRARGAQTYTLPLSGFTLQTACAYANAAAALAGGVSQVHVQVLGTNVQYTVGNDGNGNFPNGLNMGPVSFN